MNRVLQETSRMTVTATQVLRPRGPQIERIADNRAKVVIEPLERGYNFHNAWIHIGHLHSSQKASRARSRSSLTQSTLSVS